MPQIASAKKRVRVIARQTAENRLHRSRSRTSLKNVRDLVAAGKVKEAAGQVAVTQAYLDKAAKTGAIHPNTAARYKSRLAKSLKKAGNKEAIPGQAAAKKVTAAKPKAKAAKKPPAKAKPRPKK